jgi:tetratricopeptide (TPR) repeat protein
MEYLERGLTLSTSCGDTDTQCNILISIADVNRKLGDVTAAQKHLNGARKLANLSANLYQEARAVRIVAECTMQLGDYRKSIVHLQRSREVLGICGMLGGRTDFGITRSWAEVHLLKSEYTEAKSIYSHILQNSAQDPYTSARILTNIAQIDVLIGASEETVQQSLNEANTIFRTMKYSLGITCCEIILADLKLRQKDTNSATTLFQQSLRSIWGRNSELVSVVLERFANRSYWEVEEYTFTWPVVFLGHAQQSKEKLALHKALLFLGDVFIETAHSLFTAALEGFICMDVHHSRAQCLFRLGDLASKQGDSSGAAAHWVEARPLFARSQAKDVAQIDARLAELEPIKGTGAPGSAASP